MEKTFSREDGLTVDKAITQMEVRDILHVNFADAANSTVNTACSNISRLLDRSCRVCRIDELGETLVIRVK